MSEMKLQGGESVVSSIDDIIAFHATQRLKDILTGAQDTWTVDWHEVQRHLQQNEHDDNREFYELADEWMAKTLDGGTADSEAIPAIVGGEFSMVAYIDDANRYEQMMLLYVRLDLADGNETIGAYIRHIDRGRLKLYTPSR